MAQDTISILIKARDEASRELRRISRNAEALDKRFKSPTFNKATQKRIMHINEQSRMVKELSSAVGRNEKKFAGWAMSLMFSGMALKRLFDTIWKSSTKTFQEVSHSVEGSITSFDMLEGSMKFLQFMVGQALEPIAEAMIPIIDGVTAFVEKHPKLVRIGLAFTGIAGTILMVGGMTVLAANGFFDLATKIGLATTNAQGLTRINWGGLRDGLKKAKDAAVSLGNYLATTLMDSINWIRNNPVKSIIGAVVLAFIIMAILWLKRLSDELGGVKQVGWAAAEGLMKALAYPIAAIQTLITMVQLLWYNLKNPNAKAKISFKDIFDTAITENLNKIMSDSRIERGYISEPRTLKQIWQADLYGEQQEAAAIVNQQVVFNVESGASMDDQSVSRVLSAFEQYAQSSGNNT